MVSELSRSRQRGAVVIFVIIHSLHYHIGRLTTQIHHARSLPATTSGQEPNTYVKTYLKPDPTKVTKRKTKVVRKNCFPSYMETVSNRTAECFVSL